MQFPFKLLLCPYTSPQITSLFRFVYARSISPSLVTSFLSLQQKLAFFILPIKHTAPLCPALFVPAMIVSSFTWFLQKDIESIEGPSSHSL
jgi:hypothetical protein